MASAKQKGSAGEREAAKLLQEWSGLYNLTFQRNLEQTRAGGSDLYCVEHDLGLEIEVKRQEAENVRLWWAQVKRVAEKTGRQPLLMYRQNRRPWKFVTEVDVAMQFGETWRLPRLVVHMDKDVAREWFQAHISVRLGDL